MGSMCNSSELGSLNELLGEVTQIFWSLRKPLNRGQSSLTLSPPIDTLSKLFTAKSCHLLTGVAFTSC